MGLVVDNDVSVAFLIDIILVDAARILENSLDLSVSDVASCVCAWTLGRFGIRGCSSKEALLRVAARIGHCERSSVAGHANDYFVGGHTGFGYLGCINSDQLLANRISIQI